MFCPKCGYKLPDGSKFCGACGEKIGGITNEMQTNQTETEGTVPKTETFSATPKPEFAQPEKKSGRKKPIAVAVAAIVAVIVVLAAVWGVKSLLSGSGGNPVYAYRQNYTSSGTDEQCTVSFDLYTSNGKNKTVEIDSCKYEGDSLISSVASLYAVRFSPDGKYVYYITKFDSDAWEGTLCRAEYGRMKEDSDKNDKYVESIATNVTTWGFLGDNSLYYLKSDGTLYYVNEEESSKIAKNVYACYTDETDHIVYSVKDDPDGRIVTLYGVVTSDIDDKIKLASDVWDVASTADFENILYTRAEDDNSLTLYVTGFEKETEKLAEGVKFLNQTDDKIYFMADNGSKLSLYDYVNDTYAESDAEITEPNQDDYSIPTYSYSMISGDDLTESDYDELYTSCIQPLYWYDGGDCSMEQALNFTWMGDNDGVHAATQSFIDKFADSADEDGYILVDDEVKAALQEISKHSYGPMGESDWLNLCLYKYQSGTITDYDAYNAVKEKWDEAKDRISMRENLQNPENDYTLCTLYCYESGTLTAISENVLNAAVYADYSGSVIPYSSGAILYNTADLVTGRLNIEDVSSAGDVRALFAIDKAAENFVVLSDGTVCRMSAGAAETYSETYENDSDTTLYFTNKDVYLSEGNGALSVADISDGTVGDFTFVTDDAKVRKVGDSVLYYVSTASQNDDVTLYNLYSCSDGVSTCRAEDIRSGAIDIYSDDVILAGTYQEKSGEEELTMINSKGDANVIGEDVRTYYRIDKSTLLYISDGDLYSYNGKESTLLREDVDYFWVPESMEALYTF